VTSTDYDVKYLVRRCILVVLGGKKKGVEGSGNDKRERSYSDTNFNLLGHELLKYAS
jgi:hypothetical protein